MININPSNIKIKNENDKLNILEINKSNTNIQSKTERENLITNDINLDDNYSIEL